MMPPDINMTRQYMYLTPHNSSYITQGTDHIEFITIITVFLIFLSLFIILSNLLTIVMVVSCRELHKPTYYLIASLATADMLVGLAITPFFIFWLREHVLLQNPYFCKMVLIISHFLTSASIVNLMTLTIERYLAICHTIFHKFLVSSENFIKATITTEWVLCGFLTILSVFIGMKSNLEATTCAYYQSFNEEFLKGALIIGVLLPFLTMFVLYTNILYATKKHIKLKYDLSIKPMIISERLEQADSRLQKLKHNHKMTITLCLIFTSFVVCWGPFFSVIYTQTVCPSCTVPVIVKDLVVLLGFMHSLTNPIIYFLRQPNFRNLFCQSIKRIYSKTQYLITNQSDQRTDKRRKQNIHLYLKY